MCFYSVQVVPNRGPSRSKAPILASDISLFTLEYKIEQILTVNNFEQNWTYSNSAKFVTKNVQHSCIMIETYSYENSVKIKNVRWLSKTFEFRRNTLSTK